MAAPSFLTPGLQELAFEVAHSRLKLSLPRCATHLSHCHCCRLPRSSRQSLEGSHRLLHFLKKVVIMISSSSVAMTSFFQKGRHCCTWRIEVHCCLASSLHVSARVVGSAKHRLLYLYLPDGFFLWTLFKFGAPIVRFSRVLDFPRKGEN